MKTLIQILLLFVVSSQTISQQWFKQYGFVIWDNFYSVDFVNLEVGWAVGGGKIIKTTNEGASWLEQSSGTTASLCDVSFIDLNTGWVVGDSGTIIKTTDGGTNWIIQNSGISTGLALVCFTDNNTGWAAGGFESILKTENGGLNWKIQYSDTN